MWGPRISVERLTDRRQLDIIIAILKMPAVRLYSAIPGQALPCSVTKAARGADAGGGWLEG
jgi:hypothetical protein